MSARRYVRDKDIKELKFDAENGVWIVRAKAQGLPNLYRSTGEKNSVARARQIAREILSEWRSGVDLSKSRNVITFQELAEEVLKTKRTKSWNTFRSSKNQIAQLVEFFGHLRPDQIDNSKWLLFVADRRSKYPGKKLFNARKQLITILRLAKSRGLIAQIPEIEKVDIKTKAGKEFSDLEIQFLLESAGDSLRVQILMALTMGMRKGEILRLSWDRVDLEKRRIELRPEDTKTRQGRKVGISPEVHSELLWRYTKALGPYVFHAPGQTHLPQEENKTAWQATKRRAGVLIKSFQTGIPAVKIRDATPVRGRFHDLRHTFLTRATRAGANPMKLCRYAGLSFVVYEKVYLHLRDEDLDEISRIVGAQKVRGELKTEGRVSEI